MSSRPAGRPSQQLEQRRLYKEILTSCPRHGHTFKRPSVTELFAPARILAFIMFAPALSALRSIKRVTPLPVANVTACKAARPGRPTRTLIAAEAQPETKETPSAPAATPPRVTPPTIVSDVASAPTPEITVKPPDTELIWSRTSAVLVQNVLEGLPHVTANFSRF